MAQWKGIRRQWDEEEDPIFSGESNSKRWLPNIPEYVEEDEDGSAKQKFIFIDDIPEPYKEAFILWAGNKVKQLNTSKREDQGEVTEEVITRCAKTRVWKRWLRKHGPSSSQWI